MRRRQFIAVVGAAAWPLAVLGQQPPSLLRVGASSVQPRTTAIFVAFVERMAELGYEEGKNFSFEYVQAANVAGYEVAYRELASRKVDILLASGPEVGLKSALATAGMRPVVMVAIDYDPLARGYVRSLARPGANLTGISFQQIELTEKRLQVVKEAFPDVPAITVFWDEISADQWHAAENAAPRLGLRLAGVEFREQPYDYERALAQLPLEHRRVLMVLTSPVFAVPDRARLPDFALRHRMASIFSLRQYVDVGGLMSYGRASPRCSDVPPNTSIALRAAPSPLTCQSSSRPNLNSSST
ncbi:MAG TPA: ABC transporter substrate binding protein [Beijerinckiaceae bacterium]|nr:ABC transporter substrate binding protein [Beijerinckiaceae bacterium]